MSLHCPELCRAMASLGRRRPIFHSEADFQFALAWEIQSLYPDAQVRLEVPKRVGNQSYKVDLWFEVGGLRHAVELKYFKNTIEVDLSGETFRHGDAMAHDINRYDFLKDVQRMEQLLAFEHADSAYAIALTNHPQYWNMRAPGNRVDEALSIEQGRRLTGRLAWADHVGGTARGREKPIELAGEYEMNWSIYSDLKGHRNGLFRWLGVSAVPGIPPPIIRPVSYPARKPKPVPTSRSRRNYRALAEHLSSLTQREVIMSFVEVEALIGSLPPSARIHSAWWGNHAKNPQARWMDVSWKVSSVGLGQEVVILKRM